MTAHYSFAQTGTRETTGYFRLAGIPENVRCDYAGAFTTPDKSRITALGKLGKLTLAGWAPRRASKGKLVYQDSQGRTLTLTKRGSVWGFAEESSKGKVSGRMPAAFNLVAPAIVAEASATIANVTRFRERAGARGVTSAEVAERKQAGQWGKA